MSDHPDSNLREKVLFVEDRDAQRKFEIYKSRDPFPEIAPALLNSADIYDYVAATGMIAPFHTKDLKSASYEIGILGTVIYWDENGEENFLNLRQGEEFILRRNSIAFVTPESKFRLSDYIALRFNLRITHVHRGILLGTGPLVDPGFEGRLLIPLHNLTTNDYKFKGGDPLIWVEFTKLSPNKRWDNSQLHKPSERLSIYEPFPDDKKNLTAQYYLSKASPHRPIRSSIPEAIRDAQRSARQAAGAVKAITIGALVAAVIVSYGLYSSFQQSASLVQDSVFYVNDAQNKFDTIEREIARLTRESWTPDDKEKFLALEREVQDLRKKIVDLANALTDQSSKPKSSLGGQSQENAPK